MNALKRQVLALFALCAAALSAPSVAQEGFYLGVTGNVGASMVTNQNDYGVLWNVPGKRDFELAYRGTIGYGGGLKFGYNFAPQFGMELHLGYQDRGMRYRDTDVNDVTHRRTTDADYVYFALPFRYTSILKRNRFKQFQRVRLAIVAGPQIGILAGGGLEYTLETDGDFPLVPNSTFDDETVNFPFPSSSLVEGFPPYYEAFYTNQPESDRDLYSTVDFGLMFMIGVDIYATEWFYISPGITGYLGVTDINAKAYRDHSGYSASRHAAIGFGLSVGFYLSQ